MLIKAKNKCKIKIHVRIISLEKIDLSTGHLCIIDCHLDIVYDKPYIQTTEVQRTFGTCCVTKVPIGTLIM